jgi:hypothetical protein
VDAVTTFFERSAVRLSPLQWPLGIAAVVLFVVAFAGFGRLGSGMSWTVTLAMLWSAGISLLVFWFKPKSSANEPPVSAARRNGRWMQVHVTGFFSFWFLFLIPVTVSLVASFWWKDVG